MSSTGQLDVSRSSQSAGDEQHKEAVFLYQIKSNRDAGRELARLFVIVVVMFLEELRISLIRYYAELSIFYFIRKSSLFRGANAIRVYVSFGASLWLSSRASAVNRRSDRQKLDVNPARATIDVQCGP